MWKLNGQNILDISQVGDAIGFVYLMNNLETNQFYIGKKHFYSKRRRQFSKKELSQMTDKRKKAYEVITKESNWQMYKSSNKEVQKWMNYERHMLEFCYTEKELTYCEMKWQFHYDVLRNEYSLNDNILGRFFRSDFKL